MRVRFLSPFNYVIHRNKSGTPLQTASYSPTDETITVPRAHGEAAVSEGKAVEVAEEVAVRPTKEEVRAVFQSVNTALKSSRRKPPREPA